MAQARPAMLWLSAVAAATLALAGCGSDSSLLSDQAPARPGTGAPRAHLLDPGAGTVPAPAPTGRGADPNAVSVIKAWSTALRQGDVRGAAAYFNLPSELINGTGANGVLSLITIHTAAQAQAANAALPCGARFVSADQRGEYVNALFRLVGRGGPGGSSCGSGAGGTARTNFLIENGRIVEWIRAPDDPGDNGRPGPPPVPSSPGGTPLV